MKLLKSKALRIRLLQLLAILLWELAFAYIWMTKLNILQTRPFENKGNYLIWFVYLVELWMLLKIYGGLKIALLESWNIFLSQFLSLFLCNCIMLVQLFMVIGDLHKFAGICTAMLLLEGLDLLISIVFVLFLKLFKPYITDVKDILLIYDEYSPDIMIKKFEKRQDKFYIKEKVNVNIGEERLLNKMLQYKSVLLYDISAQSRNNLLKFCYMHEIDIYLTSKISDTIIKGATNMLLFDTPLLLIPSNSISLSQRILKRVMDLLLSGLALVITSPIILAAAIAIKIEDGGPVFYHQERCTYKGRKFKITKFRSMIVDAEKNSGARLASKDDKRITKVGKFIRATRIDELPQLINVLKGDMSLVGPRPERPELIRKYKETMPEFDCRMRVKGGLTGYAQIYGKYNTTPYDKLKMDLMYIENYSFLLDIRLILMTIKIIFIKESTEGV